MTRSRDSRPLPRTGLQVVTAALALVAALLVLLALQAAPVVAAGVVGTGTPEGCTEAALDAALTGGGVLTFNCGAAPVTIAITSTKTLTRDTTIDGGGLMTISGGDTVRVVDVVAGATVELRNLTITRGTADKGGGIRNGGTLTVSNSILAGNNADHGGGIRNAGTLTITGSVIAQNTTNLSGAGISNTNAATAAVTDSTITANTATGSGGGIYNSGTLSVTSSTVAGNTARLAGGGIRNEGALAVNHSTIAGNAARLEGGGINNWCDCNEGTGVLANSTIAGNTAGIDGGGILSGDPLMIVNSSITGNAAPQGGGIFSFDTLTLANTIVAKNLGGGGDCVTSDLFGPMLADGRHNLIGDAANACGLINGRNGNLVGVDPRLAPRGLAYNGGPTRTVALLPGSPAIDAGDPQVCADAPVNGIDQRGFRRPGIGFATCSIGAFEYNLYDPRLCGNGIVDAERGVRRRQPRRRRRLRRQLHARRGAATALPRPASSATTATATRGDGCSRLPD